MTYEHLKEHFNNDDRVSVSQGKGAQGIKVEVNGKARMIVMFYKGDLVVQLPAEHVNQMIEQGLGQAFDPGTGKPMKDRVLIPHTQADQWIEVTEMAISAFT